MNNQAKHRQERCRILRILSFFTCFLMFSIAEARIWEQRITQTYLLGKDESVSSAMPLLLEKIKQEALAKSGSFLEGHTQLANEALRETITSVQSSIIKISNIIETVTVTESHNLELTIIATVTVDESILHQRIEQLSVNKMLQNEVKSLSVINKALRDRLLSLLAGGESAGSISDRTKYQNSILKAIEDNYNQLTEVFNSKKLQGLVETGQQLYELGVIGLETDVIAPMMNTPIQVNLVHLEKHSDNSMTAFVELSWILDQRILSSLSHYFNLSPYIKRQVSSNKAPEMIAVDYNENRAGQGKPLSAHKLLRYLEENSVYAQVSMGKTNISIPVMYPASAFATSTIKGLCGQPGKKYQLHTMGICFYSLVPGKKNIVSANRKNPLRIKIPPMSSGHDMSLQAKMVRLSLH